MESTTMLGERRLNEFTLTVDKYDRATKERGSAIQAQTKSQQTWTRANSRSVICRGPALRDPFGSRRDEGTAKFDCSNPALAAVAPPMCTLRSDKLIADARSLRTAR